MKTNPKFNSLSAVLLAALLLSACNVQAQKSDVISIPDGYIGWVRIDYNIKGAKPLPKTKSGDAYIIPASGYLRTSSHPPHGSVYETYQYSKGTVKRSLNPQTTIWDDGIGGPAGPNDGEFSQRTFFVGTRAQTDLAEQVHAGVGHIPLAAFSAWKKGRDLTNRDWSKRKFPSANLVGANFWNSSFKNCDFRNANLTYAAMGADFTNANFKGATLLRADLNNTVLVGVDLRGCDLRGAHLQGANLRGARLQKAKMAGAEYDSQTKWPRGFNPRNFGAQIKAYIASDALH